MNEDVTPEVFASLAAARATAPAWAAAGVRARLRVLAAARRAIALNATALAATIDRDPADTLVAEVLPLAEAASFLVRHAAGLLAPARPRGGGPLWLWGVQSYVVREPCGVVLILAPGNYPLFLAGAQALQALAAGNAVCVKPAPGCSAPMQALAALLAQAGLPRGVLTVLDEDAGPAAVAAGFDHIVLTGSASTGARVLAAAGLTPCTLELSGVDAAFVLPGADLDLVARCLAYGLRLNGGATCIAPRRVFVTAGQHDALRDRLAALLPAIADARVPGPVAARLSGLVAAAVAQGAQAVVAPGRPVVVTFAQPGMALLQQDVFAPWLALIPVADAEAALAASRLCPYALGASIFGPGAAAFARRVHAGSVCVDDIIVPTADPRLPFEGRGASGYGATRGAEGLLRLTVSKAISIRRGRFRPHLDPARPDGARLFSAMICALHGGLPGLRAAASVLSRRGKA